MAIFYGFKWKKRNVFYGIKFGICMGVLVVVLIYGMIEPFQADQSLSMYSGSYALMDGETGRVLIGKEETTPMANASTTKTLTCIVTLESCNLDEDVTISANAASQPKVRMGLKEGEKHSLKDMLYGLMLESYNDCAVAIAEHVAGDAESFAKMLNEKAKEIGCKDTYFITPNGLDAEDSNGFHHTTAEDLCKIMAYCTWNSPMSKEYLKITQTRNYASFVNRNSFLNQMDGVLTGKTGFTNKAGYCYVAAMEVNGEKYCIALLACGWPNNKNYKWQDARILFEYGMECYDKKQLVVSVPEQNIWIDGSVGAPCFSLINKKGNLKLQSENRKYHLLIGEKEVLEQEIILYTDEVLPIRKGQKMGVCNVYLDNIRVDSIPLTATDDVYIWGWKEIFNTIFYQFLTFSL